MASYSNDFQIVHDEAYGSHEIHFHCFDTLNSVTVFGTDDLAKAEALLHEARQMCLDFHRLWSFTLESSDIARINKPVSQCRVDFRTIMLLGAMKTFHEIEPSFDFTVGPVSYMWKHAEHVPSDAVLAGALEHVGATKVSVEGDVVIKSDPLTQVDVGGAAKGFVADTLTAHLRLAGIESARIDLGGNLFMLGLHPSGRLWRVSTRLPKGVFGEAPIVEVRDKAVVTSGSYERFVEIDGKRYHHIIDSSTGRPSKSDILSATVVAASALQADMLATAALLAGKGGIAGLKSRHPEAEILIIPA